MSTQLTLFGLPQIKTPKASKALRLNNPTLVLIYLAAKGEWVSRSELAFLFRPDDDEITALKHIRLLLHRAKKSDWAGDLEVDKRRARFAINTDVAAFKKAITQQNWPEAARLYSASFLGDYSNPELVTYSAWIDVERSDLESSYSEALAFYAADLEKQQSFAGAAQVLEDLLKLDPLDEEVFRSYLKFSYIAGQKDKALKAYEAFSELLKKEYETEPLEETLHLIDKIRKGEALNHSVSTISRQESVVLPVATKIFNKIPKQSTRFVGRQKELAELAEQLRQESCRLLTLVGLGGTGKTRLALELARLEQSRFKDGVCFVPLAALSSANSFVTTLAQTLDLTLAPRQDTKEQLIQFLANKDLLLVLDNFEHLLEASSIVKDLLEGSEILKLIVTSRERLNLKEEWIVDLEGLNYPDRSNRSYLFDKDTRSYKIDRSNTNNDTDKTNAINEDIARELRPANKGRDKSVDSSKNHLTREQIEAFDSVQLFINSARRVAPKLEFLDEDLEHVIQIAQKVEGLPLALELAASWARIMPIKRIAKELENGYELLENAEADVPERQRSITAILNRTWQGLSEKKRQTLARFSVFQGGATLEAAEDITGTHFSILLSLVNEALLKRIPPNRFDIHPLLRQFAKRQHNCLTTDFNTSKRHEDHYSLQVAQTWRKSTQNDLVNLIDLEFSNIQTAWQHAVKSNNPDIFSNISSGMWQYFYLRGRALEGLHFFDETIQFLRAHKSRKKDMKALAHCLDYQGRLYRIYGDLQLAQKRIEESLSILKALNQKDDISGTLSMLATILVSQGKFQEAKPCFEEALKLSKEHGLDIRASRILSNLATLEDQLGNKTNALTYMEEVLSFRREQNNKNNLVVSLTNYGLMLVNHSNFDKAKDIIGEALALAEELKFNHLLPYLISGLGRIAFAQKSYSEALEHFNKALLLSKEMNNQEMQPDLLNVIARATLAKNKKIEARNYLYDALKHALELGTTSKLIDSIAGLAELAIADNKFEVALELLLQIKEHTSTEAKTADWIENMYQSVKHASSPDKLQTMPLKDYARELLKQTAF